MKVPHGNHHTLVPAGDGPEAGVGSEWACAQHEEERR